MGSGISAALLKAAGSNEENNQWERLGRGPTLRRLFGAYSNPDLWAVARKFRQVDDGNGYVSYEELQQVVHLEEFNLLFIWDVFSQQNELLDSKELFCMICIFSSAKLVEKGRFLASLFDVSKTGISTGGELATLSAVVLGILAKCSGTMVKAKEVTQRLRRELPELVPQYRDALRKHPTEADCFNLERIIAHNELDSLMTSIRDVYESLPVAGQPPPDAVPPPPPDWGAAPATDVAVGGHSSAGKTALRKQVTIRGAGGAPTTKLTEAELQHLSWMSRLGTNEEGVEEKENLRFANSMAARGTKGGAIDAKPEPAKSWMVIHGNSFDNLARDLHGFRRIFIRSIASSLAVPVGCVEVSNVSRGISGGVIVEFTLHPSGRGNDTRDGDNLVELLGEQLNHSHSVLRKGAFATYAESAEILTKEPVRPVSPAEAMERGVSTRFQDTHRDQGTQFPEAPDEGSASEVLHRVRGEKASLQETLQHRENLLLDMRQMIADALEDPEEAIGILNMMSRVLEGELEERPIEGTEEAGVVDDYRPDFLS